MMTQMPAGGVRRVAFHAFVVGVCGIAAAYASAFGPAAVASRGPYIMAVALPVAMVALMTFGAVRAGRRVGALALPFTLVLLMVAGGFLLALSLPPDTVDGVYWLGLPRRAAVIVYGVGILPLFILPLAYALTFSALTLDDADIARVRAARLPDAHGPGAAS
ncbi:MAG: hypothetical protein V4617_16500 [Gemmatimonadota bacterium]